MSDHYGDLDPAFIAKADQQRALTGENVTRMAAAYRGHVEQHGGDTMCAWGFLAARIITETRRSPVLLADLVSGCIDRIVKLEQELGR